MERLRSEAGFSIIEALVSSVILVIASMGIFTLLDSGSRAATGARQRSTAAAIAQQDQERLRALPPAQLITKDETRPLAFSSGQYSVRSQGKVVRDADGDTGCTSGAPDYVRLTSTVTWTGMAGATPVTISSLVDRPLSQDATKSSILIQVFDAAGNGVNGATVTPSPAIAGAPATTDTDGCWSVTDLTPGTSYTLTLTKSSPGPYVDTMGNTSLAISTGALVTGVLFRKTAIFDQSGSVTASVWTRVGGVDKASGTMPTSTAAAESVTFAQAGLPAGVRTMAVPVTAVKFFPFPSTYGAYTGTCTANNGLTPPAGYANSVAVSAGASAPNPLKLFQPAMNVTVKKGAALISGARVFFTPVTGSGCSTVYMGTTNAAGQLADPGLPYGTYDVCADTTSGLPKQAGRLANQPNTAVAGSSPTVSVNDQTAGNLKCA
jgi:hypothetical protein